MKTTAMATKKKAQKEQTEPVANELREPIWSVVSWEKREAGGLTYVEAEQKIAELLAKDMSGLCIISDEAAERIKA